MRNILAKIKLAYVKLDREVMTLWFVLKHPDTPWYVKLLAMFVVAYALSPIDLIPDFIPVIGLLDDLIIILGSICLLFKLVPNTVLEECRVLADSYLLQKKKKPISYFGLIIVLTIWGLIIYLVVKLLS
ncbi:MAG: YkvA family protein [Candidatus Berkiella sp.]